MLFWFDPASSRYELVFGSTLVPDSYAVDAAQRKIHVILDNTSAPRLVDLSGGSSLGQAIANAPITLAPSNVTAQSATLRGTFTGDYGWLEWDTTLAFGNSSEDVAPPNSTLSITVTNLEPDTLYYCRARTANWCASNATFRTAPRPLLTNTSVTNRLLHFELQGAAGQIYTLQTSTNLIIWETLTNFTVGPSNSAFYSDPEITNRPKRFFRVVAP
jgi:hypothetical protein